MYIDDIQCSEFDSVKTYFDMKYILYRFSKVWLRQGNRLIYKWYTNDIYISSVAVD